MCKYHQPSAGEIHTRIIGLVIPVQHHLISSETCLPPPNIPWPFVAYLQTFPRHIMCIYKLLSAIAMSFIGFFTHFQQHGVFEGMFAGSWFAVFSRS